MAQCAYCKTETEMYEGGDVPICPECWDARKPERKLLSQFPSGLPHPDGAHCIQDVSRKLIAARKAMGGRIPASMSI
jgi:hypothetical protein